MMNKNSKSEHSCLLPGIRGNTLLFTIQYDVCFMFVLCIVFIILRYVPSITTLLKVFILNHC